MIKKFTIIIFCFSSSPWVQTMEGPDEVCKDPNKTKRVFDIIENYGTGFNGKKKIIISHL